MRDESRGHAGAEGRGGVGTTHGRQMTSGNRLAKMPNGEREISR